LGLTYQLIRFPPTPSTFPITALGRGHGAVGIEPDTRWANGPRVGFYFFICLFRADLLFSLSKAGGRELPTCTTAVCSLGGDCVNL